MSASAHRGLTLFAAALLAGGMAGAAPQGQGKRLGLLELQTPPTMIGLGAQVVQNLELAAVKEGYQVVSFAEIQTRLGPEGAQRLSKCGVQKGCLLALLAPLGLDRVVYGSLDRDPKSYLLKLWMVEQDGGAVVADVDRAILIASRRFKQDVAEIAPRLLRGEREARGTLRITANVKNATVWVDGAPQGKTPVELELKPGKYQVQLEKKAYLPIKRYVDVFANKVTEEEFRLILEPGGVPEEEEVPPLVAQAEPEAPGAGLRVTPPAWVAFGAAALTAGLGGYFGVQSQRAESDLLAGFDPATRTYQGTRALALQGQANARTANILFAGAGAAAVAGALFMIFDVGGDAPVTAAPAAGPGAAGVQVEGRF